MEVKIGYGPSLMAFPPADALKQAVEAERIGFDSIWSDDHFLPGPGGTQCAFAWTWMSSALQATERVFFSTAVTAPLMRYNPAVVAQAFATMGVMYPGRVGIGVGSGEELNELAVLELVWPSPGTRLAMLAEAVLVMNRLWTSTEPISCKGTHYTLDNAAVLTKPEEKIPLYFSAIGPRAAKMAGRFGDSLITIMRDPHVVKDVILPNFEAGAKEAGKDPDKMERAVSVLYFYDPHQYVDPKVFEISADKAKIEIAGKGTQIMLLHSAEDIIKAIEELKGLGFNHIIWGNGTSGLPDEDMSASLNVFKDVLPHIV